MKIQKNKKLYKKIALTFSLAAIVLWAILGTGASLAWFTDTSEEVNNIFHIADFDINASYYDKNGNWVDIDGRSDIFNNEALYEPGYVDIVYLKIENAGDVAFNFKTAVSVVDYTPGTNAFGMQVNLQDSLRFGIVFAPTKAELDVKLSTRELAKSAANMRLNNYSTDQCELAAGAEAYIAIVVRMPEEIGNEANFVRTNGAEVELGIIVEASQKRN